MNVGNVSLSGVLNPFLKISITCFSISVNFCWRWGELKIGSEERGADAPDCLSLANSFCNGEGEGRRELIFAGRKSWEGETCWCRLFWVSPVLLAAGSLKRVEYKVEGRWELSFICVIFFLGKEPPSFFLTSYYRVRLVSMIARTWLYFHPPKERARDYFAHVPYWQRNSVSSRNNFSMNAI